MAGSVNKAIIIGFLGKDPEIKMMQNGNVLASFSVATSERWKDKSGAKQERTTWHTIVIFNENLVAIVEKYLRKGSQVYLEGQIENRTWEDDTGKKHYRTEIVLRPFKGVLTMLGSKDTEKQAQPTTGATAGQSGHAQAQTTDEYTDDGDLIPF